MSETTKMRCAYTDDDLQRAFLRSHADMGGIYRELLAYRECYGDIDAPPKSPPGSAWFSHSPDRDGFEVWPTAAEAKAAAEKAFAAEEPMDGWSDGVESICWGRVHGQVIKTEDRPRLSGDNHDCDTTQAFELSAPEHRELEQLRGLHETVTAALDRVPDDADLRSHLVVALRLYRTVRRIVERTESHKRVPAPQPVAGDCVWIGGCEPPKSMTFGMRFLRPEDRAALEDQIAELRADLDAKCSQVEWLKVHASRVHAAVGESCAAHNVIAQITAIKARLAEVIHANENLDVIARGATAQIGHLAKAIGSEATDPEFILADAEALKASVEKLTAECHSADRDVERLGVEFRAMKAEAARYRAAIVDCIKCVGFDAERDRASMLRDLAMTLLTDEERGA